MATIEASVACNSDELTRGETLSCAVVRGHVRRPSRCRVGVHTDRGVVGRAEPERPLRDVVGGHDGDRRHHDVTATDGGPPVVDTTFSITVNPRNPAALGYFEYDEPTQEVLNRDPPASPADLWPGVVNPESRLLLRHTSGRRAERELHGVEWLPPQAR